MPHIYDKIYQERRKRKFNCVCGGKYTLGHKARHKRSKIHQKYIYNKIDLNKSDEYNNTSHGV